MMDILKLETYNPVVLLEVVSKKLNAKSDRDLAHKLAISPPIISRMRQRRVPINAAMLVRMYDATGMSIDELRCIGGIPKTFFGEELEAA